MATNYMYPYKVTLMLDGAEANMDVTSAAINAATSSSDTVPFSAGAGGGTDYSFAATIIQDATVGSTWDQVWSHSGEEIDGIFRPYGNAAASATQPHYHFTATVKEPSGTLLGGDYNSSLTAKFTIQVEWPLTGKPAKVIT